MMRELANLVLDIKQNCTSICDIMCLYNIQIAETHVITKASKVWLRSTLNCRHITVFSYILWRICHCCIMLDIVLVGPCFIQIICCTHSVGAIFKAPFALKRNHIHFITKCHSIWYSNCIPRSIGPGLSTYTIVFPKCHQTQSEKMLTFDMLIFKIAISRYLCFIWYSALT